MPAITAWNNPGISNDRHLLIDDAPAGSDFVSLDMAYNHAIALKNDGSLVSWGWDAYGQVSGTPGGTGLIAAAAGPLCSLAINGSGEIGGWGDERGSGILSDVPAGTGFVELAIGRHFEFGAALNSSGVVTCWGEVADWFGAGTPPTWLGHAPLTGLPTGTGHHTLRCGFQCAGVLDEDDELHLWGRDLHGQISQAPGGAFVDFSFGGGWVLGVRPTGELVSWGNHGHEPSSGGMFNGWSRPLPALPGGTYTACGTLWWALPAAYAVSGGSLVAIGAAPEPPGGTSYTAVSGRYAVAALG